MRKIITSFSVFILLALLLSIPTNATEPVLARLAFWVPPERMSEFEGAYAETIRPVLDRVGLRESLRPSRGTIDSVYSKLFEFESTAELVQTVGWLGGPQDGGLPGKLAGDAGWQAVMRQLGAAFGTSGTDGFLPYTFLPYEGRLGSGKVSLLGQAAGTWRDYSVKDGLPNSFVLSVTQDSDGYMWFGTVNGVSRFDGAKWTTLRTGHKVGHVFQDRAGNLWFTSTNPFFGFNNYRGQSMPDIGSGVTRYDGKSLVGFSAEDGLASDQVNSIFQDRDGTIWFGTDMGVSSYRPSDGEWNTLTEADGLADDLVMAILQDRDGKLWFGTGKGVSRYDGRSFLTITSGDGSPAYPVVSGVEDRRGTLWFGMSSGAMRVEAGRDTFSRVTWVKRTAYSIMEDRDGRLWFGTSNGVILYDPSDTLPPTHEATAGQTGTGSPTFTIEDGLAHNLVYSVFQDREGYMWFGTAGGLSRYDDQTFLTLTAEDGLAGASTRVIHEDKKGDLFFGSWSGGGLTRYDGTSLLAIRPEDGLPTSSVRGIHEDGDGVLWLSTDGGGVIRVKLSDESASAFSLLSRVDGLVGNRALSIVPDRDGHLWFGTRDGLSRYDGAEFVSVLVTPNPPSPPMNWNWPIYQDRAGQIWFGYTGGFSRYDSSIPLARAMTDDPAHPFPELSDGAGIGSSGVFDILEDRSGHIWIATLREGVRRYDPSAGPGANWEAFDTSDGLGHDEVYSILEDKNGHLWFGLWQGGVSRFDGEVSDDDR